MAKYWHTIHNSIVRSTWVVLTPDPQGFLFASQVFSTLSLGNFSVPAFVEGGSAFGRGEERGFRFVPWLFPPSLAKSINIHQHPWWMAMVVYCS